MNSIDKLNDCFNITTFNPLLIIFIIGAAAGFGIIIKYKNPGIKMIGILLMVVSIAAGIMILDLTN